MRRLLIYGLMILFIGAVCAVFHAKPQGMPGQAALVQTTTDVEVRILPDMTEIVLPVGTNFVVSRQADRRVVLRFVHRAPSAILSGQKPVP